jgi:hypothetical protein
MRYTSFTGPNPRQSDFLAKAVEELGTDLAARDAVQTAPGN